MKWSFKNKRAQALLEMAIIGSIVIGICSFMIVKALVYLQEQRLLMESFRRAVKLAMEEDVYKGGEMASYLEVKDVPLLQFAASWGAKQFSQLGVSHSVIWTNQMFYSDDGEDSQPYMQVVVNGEPISGQSGKPYLKIEANTFDGYKASMLDALEEALEVVAVTEDSVLASFSSELSRIETEIEAFAPATTEEATIFLEGIENDITTLRENIENSNIVDVSAKDIVVSSLDSCLGTIDDALQEDINRISDPSADMLPGAEGLELVGKEEHQDAEFNVEKTSETYSSSLTEGTTTTIKRVFKTGKHTKEITTTIQEEGYDISGTI